jgi:hypothetical protein
MQDQGYGMGYANFYKQMLRIPTSIQISGKMEKKILLLILVFAPPLLQLESKTWAR